MTYATVFLDKKLQKMKQFLDFLSSENYKVNWKR